MSEREVIHLSVKDDYSETPGPRRSDEGDYSGELFRESLLAPRLKEALECGALLEVNLDGTAGYGTSFLEEAFGGLIRISGFRYKDIKDAIRLVSREEEYLIADVEEYMREEAESEK